MIAPTFQSTPPARGATRNSIHRNNTQATISIHAPREGGDGQAQASQGDRRISIHAPREGGDCTGTGYTPWCLAISIHAPREGGDVNFGIEKKVYYYFNPRPPRGGRPMRRSSLSSCTLISIHAPREGGDKAWIDHSFLILRFQSTPPARGATRFTNSTISEKQYFNPRPPRGGRLYNYSKRVASIKISIHAPREGGDV